MRALRKIVSTEFLLLCGVVGPTLFFVVLLIEGATRPGYSAWRVAGSYLALSNQGWEQMCHAFRVIRGEVGRQFVQVTC